MAELLYKIKKEKINRNLLVIVELIGSVDNTNIEYFNKLMEFIMHESKYFLLLMNELKFLNSTSISMLVKLAEKIHGMGGKLFLSGVQGKILAIFATLGLTDFFRVFDTEENAIEHLRCLLK